MALTEEQHQTIQRALERTQTVAIAINEPERVPEIAKLKNDLTDSVNQQSQLSPEQVREIGFSLEAWSEELQRATRWRAPNDFSPTSATFDAALRDLEAVRSAGSEFSLTYLYKHPDHRVDRIQDNQESGVPGLSANGERLVCEALTDYSELRRINASDSYREIQRAREEGKAARPYALDIVATADQAIQAANAAVGLIRNGEPLTEDMVSVIAVAVQSKGEHLYQDAYDSKDLKVGKALIQMNDALAEAETQLVTALREKEPERVSSRRPKIYNPIANPLTEFVEEQRDFARLSTGDEATERAQDAEEATETLAHVMTFEPLNSSDLWLISDAVEMKKATLTHELEAEDSPFTPGEKTEIREEIKALDNAHLNLQKLHTQTLDSQYLPIQNTAHKKGIAR
ncbi:hypothetical protein DD236_01470 [Ancrocorticia populi]|uniref:Uncharacterized protein n=1 Tax=Ancrocorticia populi TaxID=2175228 RepID=A0A2V1K7L8_9ACTO|nr:hypothetical protein DD236_01470 [Ancrocorticia populi]